jgi:hypothetical protein
MVGSAGLIAPTQIKPQETWEILCLALVVG